MLKKLQKSEKGFTIIEVMIVLAIAGLILLIVFLAVPALQRNSRNTQRKSDIGRIGSAATTVASNNNNNYAAVTATAVQTEVGNLGYYQTANVGVASGAQTNSTDVDHVVVVTGAKCSGADSVAATRQIAVLYSTEGGGGGATHICVDQ